MMKNSLLIIIVFVWVSSIHVSAEETSKTDCIAFLDTAKHNSKKQIKATRVDNELSYSESHTVKDVDGNIYKTIKIGNQIWLKENLKVTHYRNGDAIPKMVNNTDWSQIKQGVFLDCTSFGHLYNWYAINDNRNIAPIGWHIPSKAEWDTLINFLGGNKKSVIKLKSTVGWKEKNKGTNMSGFSALPCGMFNGEVCSPIFFETAQWWSSTIAQNSDNVISFTIQPVSFKEIMQVEESKYFGLAIRCIKD